MLIYNSFLILIAYIDYYLVTNPSLTEAWEKILAETNPIISDKLLHDYIGRIQSLSDITFTIQKVAGVEIYSFIIRNNVDINLYILLDF